MSVTSASRPAPPGPGSPPRGLRPRVLVPLAVAMIVVLSAFVWIFARETGRRRTADSARTATLVEDLMRAQLADGVQVMSSTMGLVMRDQRLEAALLARDRGTLLQLSRPILDEIRARNQITHFYYILPDRTMLLRVQVPDEWGDKIDRFVLREAQRTGQPFWGNEQGPFGSLTSRVTHPWYRDGAIIGYLEMGIDLEDVMQKVHKVLALDVFVAIEKRFFDREKWDRMQRKLGRRVDWDEFPAVIVLSRTQERLPPPLAAYLRGPRQGYAKRLFEVTWEDRVAQAVVLPFVDLRGRELGEILVSRDVTTPANDARRTIVTVVTVCMAAGGALLLFCFGLLGRVERDVGQRTSELKTSHERLELEVVERKRTEHALEQHARELARSNAELEQLVYVASHDLQEPLRMVSSYVQLLERRYQEGLDADAREFISYAAKGAQRMHALIVDLLAYSRVGAGRGAFATTDCEAVLATAIGNLRVAIDESGARVLHTPLPTVTGDATQLTQLMQNLIANAIKFRRDEAPEIHIAAEADAEDGERWRFSVRDNGIGIDADHFARVFVLFQRLHPGTAYPGTGIGLAICKKVVERHGGRIWVESAPGSGSTFFFTIPRDEHAPA